jgi:HPt (histidine-containing phosphotransfer) domain-containing protein
MATLSPPDTQQKLMAIWERNRPQVMERLALLERAAEAHPLSDQLREEAVAIAHKLAGSLGMFGFAEGTRLARSIEYHLEAIHPNSAALAALSTELRHSLFPTDA